MTPYELGVLAAQRRNVPGHLKQAYAEGFAGAFEKRAAEIIGNRIPGAGWALRQQGYDAGILAHGGGDPYTLHPD